MQTFYVSFSLQDTVRNRAVKATNSMEAMAQWSAFEAAFGYVGMAGEPIFISLGVRKVRGIEYAEGW